MDDGKPTDRRRDEITLIMFHLKRRWLKRPDLTFWDMIDELTWLREDDDLLYQLGVIANAEGDGDE